MLLSMPLDENKYILSLLIEIFLILLQICGTWRDIPPVYMQYIVQGRVVVAITTRNHRYGEVSGKLVEDTSFKSGIKKGSCYHNEYFD